jgi:hypothetical protein
MATQNINIDQNQDTDVDITDVAADPDDKIIMAFYENGVNIFNLATENMGGASGEITIVEDTKYTAAVTDEKALLLNPQDTLTHKVWKFDANNIPTEIHLGSVTNEPLTGSSPSQSALSYNNDRMYSRVMVLSGVLTEQDQIVTSSPLNSTTVTVAPPDATTVPEKEFYIKNIATGSGILDVISAIEGGTGIIRLDAGEYAWIRAKTNPADEYDYLILMTTGAIV